MVLVLVVVFVSWADMVTLGSRDTVDVLGTVDVGVASVVVVLNVESWLFVTTTVSAASVVVTLLVTVFTLVMVRPGTVTVECVNLVTNWVLTTVLVLAGRVVVFPVPLVVMIVVVERKPGTVVTVVLRATEVVVSKTVDGFSVLVFPVIFVAGTMVVKVAPAIVVAFVVALVKMEKTVTVVTGLSTARFAFATDGIQDNVVEVFTVSVEVVVIQNVDVVALREVVLVPDSPTVVVMTLVCFTAFGVTVEVTVMTLPRDKVVVKPLGVEVATLVTVVLLLTVVALAVVVTTWVSSMVEVVSTVFVV
jgi:hypothetical protein